MTEAPSHAFAEQPKQPRDLSQNIGLTAIGDLGRNRFEELTMADVVDMRSRHLLDEFSSYENEIRAGAFDTSEQLAVPRLIQRFVHQKVEQMKAELPDGSPFRTSLGTIPVGMVLDRVSSLRRERNAIIETSKRPAFMREQNRHAAPIAAANADTYPQLHFLGLLRKEFQDSGNTKYAINTSELIIATARTLQSIHDRSDAGQAESNPQ